MHKLNNEELDFAKMAAPSGVRLGARQRCKPYAMVDLWTKCGAFGKNLNQTILVMP